MIQAILQLTVSKSIDQIFPRYAHCQNDKQAEFQYKAGNNVCRFNFYLYTVCIHIDTFTFLNDVFVFLSLFLQLYTFMSGFLRDTRQHLKK